MVKKLLLGGAVALTAVGGVVLASTADAAVKPKTYANCAALNKVYPHGVGKKGAKDKVSGKSKPVTTFKVDTAVYNANTKSDRDKDGIACEKK